MDKTAFNLTLLQFKKVIEGQIDLNHLYLFECILEGITIDSEISKLKVDSWKQGLLRKNWINDKDEPTENGKIMYAAIMSEKQEESPKQIIKEKKAKLISDFETWWSIFPATDIFEMNNRKFTGSRTLRVKKEECQTLFDKLVSSGEYSSNEIIEATKFDVMNKKKESVKQNKNVLSFLQNSSTYLRQQSFDGYVGMCTTPESKTSNIVDI